MKLLQLTLENFQGIRSLRLDFQNGKSASVYGENATGKTTIYNAVTWLLFDKASTGAKNFTPKTRTEAGDSHHLDHSAEGVFQTDDGRIVTLKKVFHEVYKKKRGSAAEEFSGHTIEYYIDDVPEKEKVYKDTVLGFCGGNEEIPKMLTMPDYFPEQMDWQKRREILLEVCGDITDSEIIGENPDLAELPVFLRMPGATDQSYTIDEYRKIANERRRKINDELDKLPERIDEAEKAIPSTDGLDADTIEATIASLRTKMNSLMEEKASAVAGDTATATIRQSIADLRVAIAESRAEHKKMYSEANAAITSSMLEHTTAATRHRHEAEDISADIRRGELELERLQKLRAALLDEYRKAQSEVFSETESICPTCGQPLPQSKIDELRADFNLRRSRRLEEINTRGKKEAGKEAIAALEAKLQGLRDMLAEAQSLQNEEEKRAAAFREQLIPEKPWESTDAYRELYQQMAVLESQLTDARSAADAAQRVIVDKIRDVSDAIRDEQDKLMSITMADNQRRRISELEKREEQLAAEFETLEKGLHLCDLFIKAKVSMLTDRINTRFRSVRFRLFQDQLNGGLKEDCEVMIPAEDGRLVPYAFANNAARINAGLEIIDTLSDYLRIKMPVFIDNAESVTHIYQTDTQTIRLVVSETDKKLRLEVA